MNDLKVQDFHGKKVVDSRDVAEMVSKSHKELLRTIKTYIEYLSEAEGENPLGPQRKIAPGDFFIESTYLDGNNQARPNFLITRKGCDLIANKMTGKKGVLFTAVYVTAFETMQQALAASPTPRRIPDVSPSGLAKLITVTRQVMLDMGNTPVEIGAMTKTVLETWGIPVPVAFSGQIPGQLCLFEGNGHETV